ncbi:hypothetical protein LTR56_026143 [Elasticomyces elasticus]|nr:hypothetical protein LTR56_026143 [Elasticomyces elasticus]KAK3665434.1 hypothetical protein LTR22_003664 [Elasticomyces elasticus]KAK4929922.1 hypothetical protein LTR49_003549 [Elasticomyces elasticus]KAK5769268.1 hypothetical protein LTS12_000619 [Elasticomyces elasticus]
MAPPPPTSITLTVKVPPGHLEGGADHFPLGSVDVSSTIGAIRQQIQSVVPSHPAPEKQRLLYGGRALVDNEQTLADALNTKRDSTQTEYVIHLLVKGEGHGSSSAPAAAQGQHQRAVSTPVAAAGGQGQPQVVNNAGLTEQQQLMQERQQHMRNAMLQQQQQQRAQMAQMNMNMGMPMQPGLMPPNPFAGLQQFPGGMPQMMGHNFNQAVAQGQQQRAAMGMHGVGQPAVPQQDGTGTAQPQMEGQQSATQATANVNGQPAQQQQQHPPGLPRPVSGQGFHFEGIGPNGERVQIHQQVQAFQLPLNGLMPQFGIPQFAAQPQMPFGAPQQPQPLPSGQQPSALDRARENMTEMRRMLDEMRDSGAANEEQRSRIERLRERVQGVNDYIDPLNVHGGTATIPPTNPLTQPLPPPQGLPPPPPTMNFYNRPTAAGIPFAQPLQPRHMQHIHPHQQQPTRATDTTCYLLSGPQGPQALLFSPQHGTYTGAFTTGPTVGLRPTPTTTAPGVVQQQQPNPQQQTLAQLVQQAVGQNQNQQLAANPAAPQAANAPAADPNAPAQAIMNNIWLLFRVLIFVYFVMGSNLGWRRPAALAVIGIGFWMVRAGLFGEGGVARRWWEGVVRVGPVAPAQAQAAGGGGQGEGQGQGQGQEGQGAAGQGAMPTPEEVARRLIDEQRDQRLGRWREVVRPVERAVALFVASLWPGIGEAHVRDQEREVQRLRDEAEVEVRRREEEAKKVEEEKVKNEAAAVEASQGGSEKKAPAGTAGSSTGVAAQASTAAAAAEQREGSGSGSATAEGL